MRSTDVFYDGDVVVAFGVDFWGLTLIAGEGVGFFVVGDYVF